MTENERRDAIAKVNEQIDHLDLKIARLQVARDNLMLRLERLNKEQGRKSQTTPTDQEKLQQSQAARKRQAKLVAEKLELTGMSPQDVNRLTKLSLDQLPLQK